MSAAGLASHSLLACLAVVLLLGLLSALLARLSHGSRRQVACQRAFLGCMVLVGVSTIVSLVVATGWWLPSGTTFSLMVLTAIWDFGGPERQTGW